jgi:nucleotide-binding universal stress UspA family protein
VKALSRILAATDLSAPARHAAHRAFGLAAATGAGLTLSHVVSEGALGSLRHLLGAQAVLLERQVLDEAREELSRLAERLGQAHGVSAAVHLATGVVLSALLEHADAIDADLLVLGARGEGYLRSMLLGTTSSRLLRRTRRPVLVVKQTPHEPYRRILVPVDLSASSAAALRLAGTVAPGAERVLLHACDVPFESNLRFAGVGEEGIARYRMQASQEARAGLQALVAGAGAADQSVRVLVRYGDASRTILTQEQEMDCDLIVMGKHGQAVIEELLLGSVTKHVLYESACDVLVVSRPGAGECRQEPPGSRVPRATGREARRTSGGTFSSAF